MQRGLFSNQLDELPDELLLAIFTNDAIDSATAFSLLLTSRRFQELMQRPAFWQRYGVKNYAEFMQHMTLLSDPADSATRDPLKLEYRRLALQRVYPLPVALEIYNTLQKPGLTEFRYELLDRLRNELHINPNWADLIETLFVTHPKQFVEVLVGNLLPEEVLIHNNMNIEILRFMLGSEGIQACREKTISFQDALQITNTKGDKVLIELISDNGRAFCKNFSMSFTADGTWQDAEFLHELFKNALHPSVIAAHRKGLISTQQIIAFIMDASTSGYSDTERNRMDTLFTLLEDETFGHPLLQKKLISLEKMRDQPSSKIQALLNEKIFNLMLTKQLTFDHVAAFENGTMLEVYLQSGGLEASAAGTMSPVQAAAFSDPMNLYLVLQENAQEAFKQKKWTPEDAATLPRDVLETLLEGKAYEAFMSGRLPIENVQKAQTGEELMQWVEGLLKTPKA